MIDKKFSMYSIDEITKSPEKKIKKNKTKYVSDYVANNDLEEQDSKQSNYSFSESTTNTDGLNNYVSSSDGSDVVDDFSKQVQKIFDEFEAMKQKQYCSQKEGVNVNDLGSNKSASENNYGLNTKIRYSNSVRRVVEGIIDNLIDFVDDVIKYIR